MSRGSTNPLAGSGGWTSAGGKWGVSVIDLSSLASGGDTIRLKFVFGKDACNGSHGWYVDDVEVYGCPDCNRNDVADDLDLEFRAMSAPLRQIGSESPRSFAFVSPPRASGDVSVDLWAMADLGNVGESMTLTLNGTPIGDAFVGTGRDCPNEADKDSVSIPASTFNDLVAGGDATFTLFGTFVVDAGICGANNFAAIAIHYATVTPDTDDNGVIDHCENCAAAESPAPPSPLAPARNRYISFVPQNAERLTALRVTPVELPSDFGHLGGQHHWVAKPWMVTPDGHAFSRLGCRQEFLEWSSYAVVHVGDDEIVPGARYDVQAFDLACAQSAPEDDPGRGDLDFEAPPHRAWTASAWGDLTNEPGQAPRLDVQDVAALVDILRDAGGGADIAAADLEPAVPNGRVDAIDLAAVVDAVRGEMYPFSVECLCCRERVGPSHNSAIRRQTVLPQSSGLPGSNGYD
jgi:hypothetical protein